MEEDILSFGQKQPIPQVKEFQCPICTKFFSRKFTLETHLLIHQGVKPHICPFCGKSFRQKGTLMRHEVLHSNKNFFHCSLCNRSFRQKNIFFHHLRHRHNVSTENLDRRRCSTQLAGSQSLIDSLPAFALADTTAIASSGRHLEAVLFQSCNPHAIPPSDFSQSVVLHNEDETVRHLQENSKDCKMFSGQHNTLLQNTQNVAVLPDSSSTSCNWQNVNVKHNVIRDPKCKFRVTCRLCYRLFVSQVDYNQHIEKEHNTLDMLVDEKPFINSSVRNWGRHQLIESGALNPIFETESRTQTAAKVALSSESNLSASSCELPSVGNVSSEVSLTCIPCQLDFTAEEEFECHVKMHVQSVLCDSDSVDDEKHQEILNPQVLKGNDSLETLVTHRIQDCFDEGVHTKTGSHGQSSSHVPESYSGRISLSHEIKNTNNDTSKHHEFRSCKDTFYTGISIPLSKTDKNQQGGLSSQLEEFLLRSDSQKEPLLNKANNLVTNSKPNLLVNDCVKLQAIDKGHNFIQTYHPLKKLFVCPFCTKYCASAKALRLHTRMHINSVNLKRKYNRQLTKSEFYHKTVKKHKERILMKNGKSKRYRIIHSLQSPFQKDIMPYKHSREKNSMDKNLSNQNISSPVKNNVTEQTNKYLTVKNIHTNEAPNYGGVLSRSNFVKKSFFHFPATDFYRRRESCSSSKRFFRCEQCGKRFSRRVALHYHLQMHLTVRNFTCLICNRTFKKKALLLQHTRLNHIKSYTCGECLRVFQYESIFKYHVRNCCSTDSSSNNDRVNLPLVNFKHLTKKTSEGVIGFIPVSQNYSAFHAYDSGFPSVAIPIISTLCPNALKSIPIIGCLSVSKNMYSSV